MTWIAIFGIAFSLAMDAFAVSIANGVVITEKHLKHAVIFGFSFGIFQMVMPVAGWLMGSGAAELVTHIDHWIVFGILTGLGGKMIYESFHLQDREERCLACIPFHTVICLSLATSLDAFAVGLSFAFLDVNIVWPVIVTGAVTFCLSFAGIFIGERFGHFFENRLEALAGLALIVIGLKILISHLVMN
jgi:putative Mn2+ efflux pump MntP